MRATGAVSEFNNMTEITASTAGSVRRHRRRQQPRAGDAVADRPADRRCRQRLLRGARGDEGHLRRHPHRVRVLRAGAIRPDHPLRRRPPGAVHREQRPERRRPRRPRGQPRASPGHPRRRRQRAEETFLSQPNGLQSVYYPRANGGFCVGTQGVDFFRGGDTVANLTGVLQWGFRGLRQPGHVAHPPDDREPGDLHAGQHASGHAARGRRRDQGRRHEPAQLLHDDRHDVQHQHRSLRPVAARWTAAAPTASPSSTASANAPRS